jgi:hypothetical protein
LVSLLFSPLAGATPDPFNTCRVLGDDGSIFEWSSGGTILRRAASPLGFTDLGGTVKDLASFANGTRLVILTPNREDTGNGRKRREGLAIVYDTSRPIPTVMHRILLQGSGYGVAAAPDGRRCYILAARLEGGRGGPRFWIHGLDPEEGEVTSTTLLERPATGLAVAPNGARLFVSFEDRIQSYTTKPLVTSWHYRSPGLNGGLYFPPASNVLYAVRTGGIALFDPVAILSRDRSVPRDETDDASGSILLSFGPSALLFSGERPRAAALGAGTVAFIDLETGEVASASEQAAVVQEAGLLRPLEFSPGGDLVIALFPAGIVTTVQAPPFSPAAPDPGGPIETPVESPLETPLETEEGVEEAAVLAAALATTASGPAGDDAPELSTTNAESSPQDDPATAAGTGPPGEDSPEIVVAAAAAIDDTPPPVAPPLEDRPPAPLVAPAPPNDPEPEAAPQADPEPPPPPATDVYLSGRLRGEHTLVAALVLYGPGSIIREQVRVAPAADGSFRIPLPPPGTYRLVPVGGASRPVAASPNFHTITVQAGIDRADLDFSIEKGP